MQFSSTALFITWTVYGTFLPGDKRGWRDRIIGDRHSIPKLQKWNQHRLRFEVVLLNESMRVVVANSIAEISEFRNWKLWAVNARSNHVHVVITAPNYKPTLVRDQLKAKATRELRANFDIWKERPAWSTNGDIQFLNDEKAIEQCVVYVVEAQDRKYRGQ